MSEQLSADDVAIPVGVCICGSGMDPATWQEMSARIVRLEGAAERAPDWLAEVRGLAYMILDIKAQYLQAKECMGGDSEFLADRILNYSRYVDGPLREKVEAARNDGNGNG